MDPNTPMTVAAARYASREDAVEAFKTVWGARHQGEFDHMALAVLTKDAHDQLQVERHDSTTKHLAWGGAVLGAALVAICPPAGVVAVAAGGGAVAGLGTWVGHFWHTIPKDQIHELGDFLEQGQSGILVIAVNPRQTDIKPLLGNAQRTKIVQTKAGDWDQVIAQSIEEAKQQQAAGAGASRS